MPQLLYLVIGISLVLRTLSLLKILPINPWFHLLADGGVDFLVSFCFLFFFQIHSLNVELCRCSGFVQSFAAVTAVKPGWEYRAGNLDVIRYVPQLKSQ